MKRGGPRHPKIVELSSILKIPHYSAVGLVEMLWHFTAEYALDGGIGKHTDDVICKALCYDDASTVLVSALIKVRLVDACQCHRLRIHDWPGHCDQVVKRVLNNRKQVFLPCYDDASTVLVSCYDDTSYPNPNPNPIPMPLPNPKDKDQDPILPCDNDKIIGTGRRKRGESERAISKSGGIWEAYRVGYLKRYGAEPIRNASVNAMLCKLADQLGVEEAQKVASSYFTSSDASVVRQKHPVWLLLKEAQRWRTEMITGQRSTYTESAIADRRAATGQSVNGVIARLEAEEREKSCQKQTSLKQLP